MTFHPRLTLIAALLAAGWTAGCAVLSPEAEQQLTSARTAYAQAAGDAQVQRYAQAELNSAAQALHDAERLAKEREDSILVEHNAYLAERRARAALSSAQVRQGETAILEARAERRGLELEAREREAALARADAERAQARVQVLEKERLEKEQLEAEFAGMQAKQTDRGWIVSLPNEVLFDGTTLKGGSERTLDDLAAFLRKHPERQVAIEGFTDGSGPKDASERLSERRAQAVKFALVQRGIEPHRIDARGYGPAFPVASNDTEGGRQLNRRVEIVIDPS